MAAKTKLRKKKRNKKKAAPKKKAARLKKSARKKRPAALKSLAAHAGSGRGPDPMAVSSSHELDGPEHVREEVDEDFLHDIGGSE